MLARTAASLGSLERARLAPYVRALALALASLAGDLGNRTVRQQVADRALAVVAEIPAGGEQLGVTFTAAVMSVRMIATDLMVFARIKPTDAAAAVWEEIESRRVAVPPAADLRRAGSNGGDSRSAVRGDSQSLGSGSQICCVTWWPTASFCRRAASRPAR